MALILEPASTQPSEASTPQTPQPQPQAAPAPSTPAAGSAQPKAQPQEPPASPSSESAAAPAPADEVELAKAENARVAYGLRQQERLIKKQRDEITAREAALRAEADKRAAEEAEYAQLDELALLEKIAERKGKSLDAIVRGAIARVANGGEASPEQKMAELERLAKEAIERAAKLEEDLRTRDTREQEARHIAEQNARIEQMRLHIAASIDPDVHPYLNQYAAEEVAEHALHLANEYAVRTGEAPEFADVLEYMEQQEAQEFERRALAAGWTRQEIKAAKDAAAMGATPSPAAEPPPGREVSSGGLVYGDAALDAARRAAGVTESVVRNNRGQFQRASAGVSNGQASARGEAPVNWSAMSERERISRAAAEVFGKKG